METLSFYEPHRLNTFREPLSTQAEAMDHYICLNDYVVYLQILRAFRHNHVSPEN